MNYEDKIFGTDIKSNPPYSVVGPYKIKINLENWVKKERSDLWGKYFDYYEYNDGRGGIWFERVEKPEYAGKIPENLKHKEVREIERYFSALPHDNL